MKVIVISGRSGSGKSTALHVLEDAGFNCIDNFPVALLPALIENIRQDPSQANQELAVSIDARNSAHDLERFPEILLTLDKPDVHFEIIYLDALGPTLVKRFSETRRRHPLTDATTDLRQAIEAERGVLANIADIADLNIDTTRLSAADLTDTIRQRVTLRDQSNMSLLFRSFGYKYGVPVDGDMVFDTRCLPNPHWEPELRKLTGRDQPVIDYLESQSDVSEMYADIHGYLANWLPRFAANHRVYMTVAIGCTGGRHRSVYMAERLGAQFVRDNDNVLVRHRELEF
ncbi:MAG: RNase adapter RapZ [Gammaproteobacteria bacterium]|nr:MAG: RNase adapter RapZ [Gammaproteobacteria bacterium]